MTQEELDALMSQTIDDANTPPEVQNKSTGKNTIHPNPQDYTKDTAHYWPMPATDENKMVSQLDNVTRESEEKASQIFDIIDEVSQKASDNTQLVHKQIDVFEKNIKLFSALHNKFPDVKAFKSHKERNDKALEDANEIARVLESVNFDLMDVMDIMQFQDIHRQKIERVINVMRSLSSYMNILLEGNIDDSRRVASAQHIHGDTHNEVVSDQDIETLIAQFHV